MYQGFGLGQFAGRSKSPKFPALSRKSLILSFSALGVSPRPPQRALRGLGSLFNI